MTEQQPSGRQPEFRETTHSLLNRFQRTFMELPEFRKAVANKYPETEIDTTIKKFFSQDPRSCLSTDTFIPGIHFQKNGHEFNVNFWTQKRQLVVMRKNEGSSLIVGIALEKNNQGMAWYTEDTTSITLDQKIARQKGQELLASLKSEPQQENKDREIVTLDLPPLTI